MNNSQERENPTVAVIMAGGRGTRLWPLSRNAMPKQFHALTSDKTMLEETFARLEPIFGTENIYVATNEAYAETVHLLLPHIASSHIVTEPVARDTAPGMALVCAHISAAHPDAVVATFPADHIISNPQVLDGAMRTAHTFLTQDAHANAIVTFGIRPRYPETGFGYIKRGNALMHDGAYTIFSAQRFVEKPDVETAKRYLAEGDYEWNAGMFVFRVTAMIEKFARYAPTLHAPLTQLRDAVGTDAYRALRDELFPTMEKVSIDYAILEKDDTVAVLPLTLAWSDVGSWAALYDITASHTRENVVRGELIAHDSEGLYVRAQKPVIAIGVKDLVIVETDDALLVCDRDHTQAVSKIVKRLEGDGRRTLL